MFVETLALIEALVPVEALDGVIVTLAIKTWTWPCMIEAQATDDENRLIN